MAVQRLKWSVPMESAQNNKQADSSIASIIDHTILKPDATQADVLKV